MIEDEFKYIYRLYKIPQSVEASLIDTSKDSIQPPNMTEVPNQYQESVFAMRSGITRWT